MSEYRYHLGVYSKLIRGHTPDGPIRPGVEAKLVAHTRDFPENFQQLCTTSLFFPEDPPITKIDARCMTGGAFVYAPVYLDGKHLSVFSRIEARAERGKGQGGRKFTHCATLIIEDKWEPALIRWAARMLFTSQYGERCWGEAIYENQQDRKALPVPDLTRYSFPDEEQNERQLKDLDDLVHISRIGLPTPSIEGDSPDTPGQVDVADWLANELEEAVFPDSERIENSFAVQGRFLSFASGISHEINGPGDGGFFISLDTRQHDEIVKEAPLAFNDLQPPSYPRPLNQTRSAAIVPWRHLKPEGQIRHRHGPNTITQENFWPEQLPPQYAHQPTAETTRQPVQQAVDPVQRQSDAVSSNEPEEIEAYLQDFAADAGRHENIFAPSASEQPTSMHEGRSEFVAQEPSEPANVGLSIDVIRSAVQPVLEQDRAAEMSIDDIEWPSLLKYKDYPFEAIYPVSRERFDHIALCFRQIYKRMAVIDDAPFDVYPSHPETDRLLANSFRELLELLLDFAASGTDPNILRDDLTELFHHPSLPKLGIVTDNGASILHTIFVLFLDAEDTSKLAHIVNEIARRERSLADYFSSREHQKIEVDVPNMVAVKQFFTWLKQAVELDENNPLCSRMIPVWWDRGLKTYFATVERVSPEFFQDTR